MAVVAVAAPTKTKTTQHPVGARTCRAGAWPEASDPNRAPRRARARAPIHRRRRLSAVAVPMVLGSSPSVLPSSPTLATTPASHRHCSTTSPSSWRTWMPRNTLSGPSCATTSHATCSMTRCYFGVSPSRSGMPNPVRPPCPSGQAPRAPSSSSLSRPRANARRSMTRKPTGTAPYTTPSLPSPSSLIPACPPCAAHQPPLAPSTRRCRAPAVVHQGRRQKGRLLHCHSPVRGRSPPCHRRH